jgi:hypothetical protein
LRAWRLGAINFLKIVLLDILKVSAYPRNSNA